MTSLLMLLAGKTHCNPCEETCPVGMFSASYMLAFNFYIFAINIKLTLAKSRLRRFDIPFAIVAQTAEEVPLMQDFMCYSTSALHRID